jgi:hypothetical protein
MDVQEQGGKALRTHSVGRIQLAVHGEPVMLVLVECYSGDARREKLAAYEQELRETLVLPLR